MTKAMNQWDNDNEWGMTHNNANKQQNTRDDEWQGQQMTNSSEQWGQWK
jgi:hypothetical protein